MADSARLRIDATFRHEAGRLVGALTRLLGDFDIAEEAVQDALAEAVARWPAEGIPERPAAWLQTTARNRAIDRLRREARGREKLALIAADPLRDLGAVPQAEPDERLRLLFLCCHPALSADAQIALTLRAVAGLTTAEIASAFLTSEPTISQRILRAKRKVAAARIPYRMPDEQLGERLPAVLAVLYLMFNEGYLTSHADEPQRRWLQEEAEQLAELLTRLMPREPEPLGLLALMRLHLARSRARFDDAGGIVRLRDQDRRRGTRPRSPGPSGCCGERPAWACPVPTRSRRRFSPCTPRRRAGKRRTGRRSWPCTTCCCGTTTPRWCD